MVVVEKDVGAEGEEEEEEVVVVVVVGGEVWRCDKINPGVDG